MRRGEIWWADLGRYRHREQTGRRPVVVWQNDELTAKLDSVLIIPLTTNLRRARLVGTATIEPDKDGPTETSVALAFQMRAISKNQFRSRMRDLSASEFAELELATDEALGRLGSIG